MYSLPCFRYPRVTNQMLKELQSKILLNSPTKAKISKAFSSCCIHWSAFVFHFPITESDFFKPNPSLCFRPFSNPPTSWLNPTREEWISTLKLATKWHFWNARKVALQALQLTRAPSTEGIILGRALKISKWVLEGYLDLTNIEQTPTITNETAAAIGWETTVKLLQIREDKMRVRSTMNAIAASPVSSPSSPRKSGGAPPKLEMSVEDVFKEELSQIRQAESQYSKVRGIFFFSFSVNNSHCFDS